MAEEIRRLNSVRKTENLTPLKVSPLIKLVRWSCLIVGAIYGFVNRKERISLQNMQREREEKINVAKEEYLALEKHHINAVEMRELETIFLRPASSSSKITATKVASNESTALNVNKSVLNNNTTETVIPTSDNKDNCK